jgi:hypothetical protein
MAFYILGPKLLFETTDISTHPNSTQQESNYIYLYTTKFGTSIKIRLNRKFESSEFETMRVNCTYKCRFYFYIMYYNLSNICNFRQIYLILMRFLDKIQKTENLRDQSVHLYLEVNSQSLDHKVVCFFFIC